MSTSNYKKRKDDGPIFKLVKVFDCQWNPGMPGNVKKAFFKIYNGAGNDCYVSHKVDKHEWPKDQSYIEYNDHDDDYDIYNDDDLDENYNLYYYLLDQWLMENGAEDGEEVIINHWW